MRILGFRVFCVQGSGFHRRNHSSALLSPSLGVSLASSPRWHCVALPPALAHLMRKSAISKAVLRTFEFGLHHRGSLFGLAETP